MNNDKAIETLNTLIEINNDRIEGYETASKETDESDLKLLFATFISTSRKCRQEIVEQVFFLGGKPEEGTRITGKFFRVWMDVKAALSGKDRKTILASCEYGEDVAVATYDKEIENNFGELTSSLQSLIMSQRNLIKVDHDKIRSLLKSLDQVSH